MGSKEVIRNKTLTSRKAGMRVESEGERVCIL